MSPGKRTKEFQSEEIPPLDLTIDIPKGMTKEDIVEFHNRHLNELRNFSQLKELYKDILPVKFDGENIQEQDGTVLSPEAVYIHALGHESNFQSMRLFNRIKGLMPESLI